MERIQAATLDEADLERIVSILEAGGVVCFPTDTVYGLAVDARNGEAIERVFRLKGRSPAKPILVLVDSIEMARSLSKPNVWLDRLAGAFWPGPLTLVVPSSGRLSETLTAGTGALGLRWPDQALPIRIIRALGGPITATSANRSGEAPARTAAEAVAQLGDGIDVLIEAPGPTGSTPSTVLDLTTQPPALLREGRIPHEVLRDFLETLVARGVG